MRVGVVADRVASGCYGVSGGGRGALALQKERRDKLGRILIDLGYVAERDVIAVLSDQLKIPIFAGDYPAVPIEATGADDLATRRAVQKSSKRQPAVSASQIAISPRCDVQNRSRRSYS